MDWEGREGGEEEGELEEDDGTEKKGEGPREGPPAGAAEGQDGRKAEAIQDDVLVYPKITKTQREYNYSCGQKCQPALFKPKIKHVYAISTSCDCWILQHNVGTTLILLQVRQ